MSLIGVTMMNLNTWSKLSKLDGWVKECFFLLYDEFRNTPFTAEEARIALVRRGRALENVYKILSPLLDAGIIRKLMRAGKTYYQITFENEKLKKASKDELIKLLKSAADVIRTAVDYRVLLLLLFYKVVSDKWNRTVAKYIEEGFDTEEAYSLANDEYMKLYDEEKGELLTWDEIARKPETIHEIERAVIRIVELNGEDGFEEIRELTNRLGLSALASKEDLRPILTKLVDLFSAYDFSDVDYDVIGDAYQWILSYFAPSKAKEGETYTPTEVVRLMVKLMNPENGSTIVDPACGSAAMLIESYRYVAEKEEPRLKLYGQDRSIDMTAIAKMNVLLHGITSDVKIFCGDSLINPMFGQADYSIANPPWNQDGYSEDTLSKPELKKMYTYGYPPKNTADWAWIQLMLYTARKKAVVVIDQGALFRGGKEKEIRKKIVSKDLVEAVILLPEKLFYNTQAPGAIIVFNKEKPEVKRGKIIFINASQLYDKHPEIKRLNILKEEHIDKIVEAYENFREEEGFSKIVTLEEVKNNDYNLNVTLYVAPIAEEERIDMGKEWEEFLKLNREAEELVRKVGEYVSEIIRC